MAGKARWGQVWWVDTGLDEHKRYAIVSINGWNDRFPSVLGVRLTTSARRFPGPGFPLLRKQPRTIAACGDLRPLHEDTLVEPVDHLTTHEMQQIAIGILEITQVHRLLGMAHPDVSAQIGEIERS